MLEAITKRRFSRDYVSEEIPLQSLNERESNSEDRKQRPWLPFANPTRFKARSFNIGDLPGKFDKNITKNQKYSVVTFLPSILYEQFRFFYNLYFLLVALSQLIKPLQIGYIFTYFGPLAFVLSVTIGKEAYDDYIRFQRDKEANSQLYERISNTGPCQIPSAELKVGDLVKIPKNSRVPADCILMKTTSTNGTCFIRTDQLDGETDWKLRIAVPTSQKFINEFQILDSEGHVYAEEPNKDIHTFFGKITWRGTQIDALNVDNMLWMNTVNASDPVLGLVIYTGRDTKAVLNTSFAKTKVGLVDLEINQLAKILAAVTLVLSATMVVLDGFKSLWYIYMMRFLVLFSSIIPISLRVNLDMGKTMYSYLMMNDDNIPDTIVRTSTIPEELGRIEYLLTDKTGTLTKNEMEMRKLHMGTISFDLESMDEIKSQLRKAFDGENIELGLNFKRSTGITGRIKDIMIALSLCHNVTPSTDESGSITLQAASPDEVAIVNWTSSMGLKLVYRDVNSIHLNFNNTFLKYKIHHVFPFSSETKRMGIIVEDEETHEITFYQKGADSIMMQIVSYSDWLDEECSNYAREGLRTLVIGRKIMGIEHFQEFDHQYKLAKAQTHNREESIAKILTTYLERDLELLGLTGVEDQLQDNVKLTLEQLRNAGLHVWMLTGDKIETATCIAKSARLFSRNQQIFQITAVNNLSSALEQLDLIRSHGDACMVIDGKSLQFYLDFAASEFMSLALNLSGVVCSRCTPTQKADIVQLINSFTNKRTCAIGDGGNDVSMIQAANVGIGIVGKEGKQASLAADFSITQFQFISRLMLWHGRNSYQRTSKLAHFVIHRGLIISIMQAVFSALFYFAPIALYQGFLLVGYTTVYTMAPLFSLVYDHDISEDVALTFPELYKDLRKVIFINQGRTLSYKTFFIWLFISVYQGGSIMILAIWLFENEFIRIVSISFTALICNELFMVAMEITTWHPVMVISQIATILIYFSSMYILPNSFDTNFIGSFTFLWKVSLIISVSAFPIYFYRKIRWILSPPSHSKL